MKLVQVGDVRVAVRTWGRQGDVPLVFWHALGPVASGAELGEIAPILCEGGFRPIAVDGPGFGASPVQPPPRYELDALAALLRALLDELEVDRPVLMGHSWGGAVVLSYAAAHPEDVRALVLLDSGHIDYADLPDVDTGMTAAEWIEAARANDPSWATRSEFESWLTGGLRRPSPALLKAYSAGARDVDGRVVGSPAEARGAAMAGLTTRVSTAWPVVAREEIPTLLFLATEPPHVDRNREHIGRFVAAVPHSEVRWTPNAGHGLLADAGLPLGEEIAAWLVDQGL